VLIGYFSGQNIKGLTGSLLYSHLDPKQDQGIFTKLSPEKSILDLIVIPSLISRQTKEGSLITGRKRKIQQGYYTIVLKGKSYDIDVGHWAQFKSSDLGADS